MLYKEEMEMDENDTDDIDKMQLDEEEKTIFLEKRTDIKIKESTEDLRE